ncbi:MAG: hypothetical protein AB7E55_01300 [Pigmentiphaga sp.]
MQQSQNAKVGPHNRRLIDHFAGKVWQLKLAATVARLTGTLGLHRYQG